MSEDQSAQSADSLQALRDQVALELGRCVLVYQFIEAQLKVLVPLSTIEATAASMRDADALVEEHLADAKEFTLGMLVNALTGTVFQVEGSESVPQTEDELEKRAEKSGVGQVRMAYRVLLTAENKKTWVDALKQLVDERNRLVHHFYSGKSQWSSAQSLRDAIVELQKAHELAKHHANEIGQLVERMVTLQEASSSALDSPEFETDFERKWLCATATVKILDEALAESKDAEGWLPLATAGHRVHANPQAKEELAESQARYGHKSLRDFVKASGLFELGERPTQNGKTEVYRRVR